MAGLAVAVTIIAPSAASAAATPVHPADSAVTTQLGSSTSIKVSKDGITPDAGGGGCTFVSYIPITAYYNYKSPYALEEVIIQVSDAPACGVTAISISEQDTVVYPKGSKEYVNTSCSDCSQLNVYGSFGCTTGTNCAGKWTNNETVTWALSPDYSFSGSFPGCHIWGPEDNILTCDDSKSTNIASHNS
jgi:hypothetical protein